MLKALKKVYNYLYRVYFILETNANVLIAQLNQSIFDLLEALVTRQLAQIYLFDFKVKHISRTKYIAIDGLSYRLQTVSDTVNKENKVNINNFINTKLYCAQVSSI